MKTKFKFTLLLVLLSLSALISAQNVECFVITPPEKPLLNVKKIAILNFSNFDDNSYYHNYGGTAFVDYLTAKLLDEKKGLYNLSSGLFGLKEGKTFIKSSGINVFQIIEREQLSNVLREKNFGTEVALDDNQAAEVGKVLGVDALITGTVKHIYNSNTSRVKLTDGSSTSSTENTCSTEITMKVISVSNGQIIATKTFKNNSSDKKWGRTEGNVLGFEQLAESNMKSIAYSAATYISPFYLYNKSEFLKIKVAEFKDKVTNIKSYLEAGDLQSAYSVYKAIYDADNYNAVAAVNLAELYFITGDYEETAKWYDIATQIDPKSYAKQNEAAKKWAGFSKTIRDCGIVIDKYDFNTSSDVLAEKVTTKGNKSDRYEVYEKSDKSSVVLVKVPGETDFIVIEKSQDFTKIKLIGGKEGYISNDNTKK